MKILPVSQRLGFYFWGRMDYYGGIVYLGMHKGIGVLYIGFVLLILSGCKGGITDVRAEGKDNAYVCEFQGSNRKFFLYLPEEKPEGIIVMLHGYGETIESFRSKTFMEKYALAQGFGVCYVSSGNEPGWNYGISTSKKNDEKFLILLRDYLKKNYGKAESKMFLCGFSNGAFMTGKMAVTKPYSFDGYICVAGLPPLSAWNKLKKGANLMVVYGTKDEVIPFSSSRKNVKYNFPFIDDVISQYEKSSSHFEAVEIKDGRHQWPESRTTGYEIDTKILDFCKDCACRK